MQHARLKVRVEGPLARATTVTLALAASHRQRPWKFGCASHAYVRHGGRTLHDKELCSGAAPFFIVWVSSLLKKSFPREQVAAAPVAAVGRR